MSSSVFILVSVEKVRAVAKKSLPPYENEGKTWE